MKEIDSINKIIFVFQYISIGAKQNMNGKGVIYEIGHGGLDNIFEIGDVRNVDGKVTQIK